jgi:twinkle protein
MKTFQDYGIELDGREGKGVHTFCPQCHKDRKPAHRRDKDLSVNTYTGVWFCHHCEWKGSLEKDKSEPYYKSPTPIISIPTAKEKLYAWFSDRGISREAVDACNVETHKSPQGTSIAFLHMRNGNHIHTAFRSPTTKKFWQDSGTERPFFGLDDVRSSDTSLVICEGHVDKLAFYDAGYPNTLSVPDGAGVGDGKMQYVQSAASLLERMETVYLALDADQDGQDTMHELARRIGIDKCFIVRYPEGCKDANDVVRTHGAAHLGDCVRCAEPYPMSGIYTLDSGLLGEIEEYLAFGSGEGYKSGFDNLDALYTPDAGTVTVWTGISGHGKSTLLNHYLLGVSKTHRIPFALFTPENMPPRKFMVKLAEILLHKRYKKFEVGEFDLVSDFLSQSAIIVYPEDDMTIDRVLSLLRVTVLRHGVKMCVIDPWNMVEYSRPKDMSETEFISMVMSRLGTFAKKNGVVVHLVAHPGKFANWAGKDKEPHPNLNDIASSGNFRNKCDFGIVVWRDIYDDSYPTEVIVQKVRDDDFGRTGVALFHVDIEKRSIAPVDKARQTYTMMAKTND